jgi:hypothetical protein
LVEKFPKGVKGMIMQDNNRIPRTPKNNTQNYNAATNSSTPKYNTSPITYTVQNVNTHFLKSIFPRHEHVPGVEKYLLLIAKKKTKESQDGGRFNCQEKPQQK